MADDAVLRALFRSSISGATEDSLAESKEIAEANRIEREPFKNSEAYKFGKV